MIRPAILRVLLKKELLRLRKNPSAVMLLALLTIIALLVTIGWTDEEQAAGEPTCWFVYTDQCETDWVEYLEGAVWSNRTIRVVHHDAIVSDDGALSLPKADCAIELSERVTENDDYGDGWGPVVYHYPNSNPASIAPATAWFWRARAQYSSDDRSYDIAVAPYDDGTASTDNMSSVLSATAADKLNIDLIATMLVLAVQFFTCCHLYVSFSSQDRERGTLSAIALSPASVEELLASRFIFHIGLGLAVASTILLIVKPTAMLNFGVWLGVVGAGVGWLSIGTLITSFAKSQAQANMMMFCYMLGGGVLFFLSTQFPLFRFLQLLTFERHAVLLLHTSIEATGPLLLGSAIGITILVMAWTIAASRVFRTIGWQR